MAWPQVIPSPKVEVFREFNPPLNLPDTWSFVVISDTHVGRYGTKEDLETICQWIVDNARALNVRFVGHVGDIADERPSGVAANLELAREALQPLRASGIPFLIVPGNHDYDVASKSRPATEWNAPGRMGVDLYEGKPWFGGTFESETEEPGTDPGGTINSYITLDVAGHQFVIIGLELGPRDKVMEWANDLVLNRYPDHEVMVLTHSYLDRQGRRVFSGSSYNPKLYDEFSTDPGPEYTNEGNEMWERWMKHWPRLRAVFSGHDVYSPRQAHLMSVGVNGNKVNQIFANWQRWGLIDGVWTDSYSGTNLGSIIRIYQVNTKTNIVSVTNYSPPTDQEGEAVLLESFEYV